MYRCLLTLLLSVLLPGLSAQPLLERTYVQTDKQLYLPGEQIWLKMYVTDVSGRPDFISKIGYIELTDEKNALLQVKVDLREGVGHGWMEFPHEIPTGNYRIVAYTNYMKNEGEEVFFNRVISVVNPYQKDNTVRVGTGSAETAHFLNSLFSNGITLSTDKSDYGKRENGVVQISGIPDNLHSLSISIAGTDLSTGLPDTTIEEWITGLPALSATSFSGNYLAEYEGHLLKGKIVNIDREEASVENGVVPLLGFVGNNIRMFAGRVEEETEVTFFTKDVAGSQEIATTVLGFSSNNRYRVDVISPFYEHRARELPELVLDPEWEQQLVQRSVGVQATRVYLEDSIKRTAPVDSYFNREPDWVYILDEWTRFTTMREVVIEFIPALRFRNQGSGRVLSVLNESRTGFSQGNSLVLLDGVPLIDHSDIYNYDPLKVERINIYRGQFVFGSQLFDGVISFLTYKNDYPGLKVDNRTQFFDYEGTQAKRYFYAPDYSLPAPVYERLPDYRHTLLWEPEIRIGENRSIAVPFATSDLSGEYKIVVEGLTKDGKPVAASGIIRVQ